MDPFFKKSPPVVVVGNGIHGEGGWGKEKMQKAVLWMLHCYYGESYSENSCPEEETKGLLPKVTERLL